jgi:hypothetical protein
MPERLNQAAAVGQTLAENLHETRTDEAHASYLTLSWKAFVETLGAKFLGEICPGA